MKYLTGVGSRETPQSILDQIYDIAVEFALKGWTLRSGGANGCDSFFEAGFKDANGLAEIYLPWKKFNANASSLYEITPKALALASQIHPAWHACSDAAKRLHARNCYQVLGQNLDKPSDLLICYTSEGQEKGGSATAIKLARKYNVPVVNLGCTKWTTELESKYLG